MAETKEEYSIGLKDWLILAGLSIVWGSSFILIKKSLIVFDPIEVGALRIMVTFVAFAPVVLYKMKEIKWSKWKDFFWVGFLGSALPSVLFAVAQLKVSSSIAGVLNSMTPVFTLVLGILMFKNKTNKSQLTGVIIGFIGALMLLLGDSNADISGNLAYGSLIILATLCYGFNTNMIKARFEDTTPLIISAVSFSILGPIALIYLIYSGTYYDVIDHDYGYQALLAIVFLGLVGTGLATIIFFKLIQDTSALFGSSVAFIIPIVAVIWGLFDGESFVFIQIIGMAIVLLGIYLIRTKKKKDEGHS